VKLIFNTSMPRSGSELLQALLHQNPQIYGSATSPLLEYQYAARGNYGLPEVKSQDPALMQKAFIAMCDGMAQSYYGAITDRPIVIDKNRGWMFYSEWVEQWNPNAKMICMVRDLRSIVASMERAYRANRHTPEGIDNPAQLHNMTVAQRAGHWLNSAPVGLAVQRIQDALQRNVSKGMLFVKYESLTHNPDAELDRIYKFIEEPFFAHNFQNIEKHVHEDDSHFGIFGSHKVGKILKPSKVADWSDVLPDPIANNIRASFSWYFDLFQY
jgi:sulfotransferase